jgi:hypothetical protein
VQNLLADAILGNRVGHGDTAVVDVSNGRFWVSVRKSAPAAVGGETVGSAS